jgi:hypothetical protein
MPRPDLFKMIIEVKKNNFNNHLINSNLIKKRVSIYIDGANFYYGLKTIN